MFPRLHQNINLSNVLVMINEISNKISSALAIMNRYKLFRRLLPLLSVFLFHPIYTRLYERWIDLIPEAGLWKPAWPESRLQFILYTSTFLIWASIIFTWQITIVLLSIAYQTFQQRKTYAWRPLSTNDWQELELGGGRTGTNDDNDDVDGYEVHHDKRHSKFATFFHALNNGWIITFGALTLFGLFAYATSENAGDYRYRPLIQSANRHPRPQGYGKGAKIFIAAMFYNNEKIIPHWSAEMIKVGHYLGTDNVFFSIVESNSGDNTVALLEEFKTKLTEQGFRHHIVLHDTSIPRPPSMETATPRIQFLAAVRNLALAPLREHGGYDRVLFSNDVFLEAESVVELLNTRDGKWDMVCGVDLSFWGLYDAWVVRDNLGHFASSLWPYFIEDVGRRAVMRDEPAPVFTCWNGIVAFRADPLLPPSLRFTQSSPSTKIHPLSTRPLPKPLPSTHPAFNSHSLTSPALAPPLQFRHSAPGECFSSESFLLPYDMRRQFLLTDIFVNPRVIVSYDWNFYYWFKYVTRHWLVMWWMRNVEGGQKEAMMNARMIVGDAKKASTWDGGDCHPW